MRKQVLIFGLVGGVLVTLLQWTEFRFVVLEHSIAIYGVLIAILFAGAGIWLGTRLLAPRERIRERVVHRVVDRIVEVAVPAPTTPNLTADDTVRKRLGITPRELEILELVARGLSNREIGETLFVSENTVKTHCSRAFDKLGARRRTEAVQRSKELGLLP
ncbi:DNA-binding CsgD family transcriptional regulator [Silvibacterium bohemicum]|uniref:DNA-binding CsgD family transcriptional regulator n=1 Tax=Silvibacterium bohemicum TaxID=1577686 RepID=A0A841JVT2_9BACT|nr:response regulator transcription factor [Silvibacterium bohemicum]MBB6142548.1 DNA-binding CsgD family transcriptional regulator [Silvibacterium bohemicum]